MLDIFSSMFLTMLAAFILIFFVWIFVYSPVCGTVILLISIILYIFWRCHKTIESYRVDVYKCKCKLSDAESCISKLNSEIDSLNTKLSHWTSKADEYQSLSNDLQSQLSKCESKLEKIESYPLNYTDSDNPEVQLSVLSAQLMASQETLSSMSEVIHIYEVLSAIPRNVTFHYRDGLPVYGESNPLIPYGKWTVWVNRKTNIYHTDRACGSFSCHPVHISEAATASRPCKRCADANYSFSGHPQWYADYLKIKERAEALEICGLDSLISKKPTADELDLYRHVIG